MIKKYQEARDVAEQLNGIIKYENGVGRANTLHFDMLQFNTLNRPLRTDTGTTLHAHTQTMGQLEFKTIEADRMMIKKLLTTWITDCLRDEETDYKKVRNKGNKLLGHDVETIVKEEGKLKSNLKQVS